MPRNGAGVYSLPAGTDDFVAGTTIESAKIDALTADLQADLNNLTSGTNFWTGQFKAADGTVLLPGITFKADTDTGLWRVGANNIALSLGGVKNFDFLSTGLSVISADAGAGSGPDLVLDRNSASPAAADLLSRILFQGRDNGGGTDIYASVEAVLVDPVAATEDGRLLLKAMIAGTLTTMVTIDATGVTLASGTLSLGGVSVPTISSTSTLTNKRITPRVTSIASNATPTVNTDNCDAVDITALATAITSMTTNLSGTPTIGDVLIYQIKDDGTARGITWGASFSAKGVALPTTTVISKLLTVGFLWNGTTWGCVGSAQEA